MSPAYPHLFAAPTRTFWGRYRDPRVALAMFDHARNMSIASIVFGCATPVYNEHIETRWRCFHDVSSVVNAQEMRTNGIALDGRTQILVETVRREIGEQMMWQEEPLLGSGEVWEVVARIEWLTVENVAEGKNKRKGTTSRGMKEKGSTGEHSRKLCKWNASQEMWKKDALDANSPDGWAFDQWDLERPIPAKKQPLLL